MFFVRKRGDTQNATRGWDLLLLVKGMGRLLSLRTPKQLVAAKGA